MKFTRFKPKELYVVNCILSVKIYAKLAEILILINGGNVLLEP